MLILLLPFAWAAPLTWLAQAMEMRFAHYAWIFCTGLFVLLFLVLWLMDGKLTFKISLPPKTVIYAICISMISGGGALLFNRVDADDFYYLANATYFVAHPQSRMGLEINFIYSPDLKLTSFTWGTSTPFEYAQAAIAYVTGFSILQIYYYLNPILMGIGSYFSLFLCTSLFLKRTHANLLGALGAIVVVSFIDDTIRAVGNLYVTRIFQGKVAFLAVALPVYFYVSFLYFGGLSKKLLWLLGIIALASIGMTASSLFILVFASLTVAIVLLVECWMTENLRLLRPICLLQLPLIPVFLYGITYKFFFGKGLEANSLANADWPTTMVGHALFYFNNGFSWSGAIYFSCWLFAIYALAGWGRRVILLWGIVPWFIFLNPWLGDFFIKKLYLENIYWRLFFILPFPLVIAITVSNFVEKILLTLPTRSRVISLGATSAFLAGLLLFFVPTWRNLLNWPIREKIPHPQSVVLEHIFSQGLSGVVLAPDPVSGLIALKAPEAVNIVIRLGVEQVLFSNAGAPDEAWNRFWAAHFLWSADKTHAVDFKKIVLRYRPDHIVVAASAFSTVYSVLASSRNIYCVSMEDDKYVLLTRETHCPSLMHDKPAA